MTPKKFWVQKNVGSKLNVGSKKFWVKRIRKNQILVKKISVKKILAQKYFIPKNFEGQKSWDSKYGSKRNCGSENVLAPKKFEFEQILCPKIFRVKTTWSPKKYWRKNI